MVTGQEAGDHLDELSRKYHDEAYPPDNSVSERVMPWIGPSRQTIVDADCVQHRPAVMARLALLLTRSVPGWGKIRLMDQDVYHR